MTAVEFPGEAFDEIAAFYSIRHVPAVEQGALNERIVRWLIGYSGIGAKT